MSHFTTIAVEIKNGDLLQQTLKEMGYPVHKNATVRGYLGNEVKADYVIPMPNGYDLGFQQKGDRYELIADMWGVAMDVPTFVEAIHQQYAAKLIVQSASNQGFAIEQQEILEDGTIRIVVGRWN